MSHFDQHIAPVILMGQGPHRRSENIVLATWRAGKKAAPSQRLCQAKGTAAVDAEQLRQLPQRNGLLGESDGLKNRQASVEALDKWGLRGLLRWHISEITPGISLQSTSNRIGLRQPGLQAVLTIPLQISLLTAVHAIACTASIRYNTIA